MQPDLFTPRYPDVPGHRNVDTSIAAAEEMKDATGSLRSAPISFCIKGHDQ